MAESENSVVWYRPDHDGRRFYARLVEAEETPAVNAIREQHYYRRYVAPHYITEAGIYSYFKHVDEGGGLFAPDKIRVLGLYAQHNAGDDELVAFQSWGGSTRPKHRDTSTLLGRYGASDERGENNISSSIAYIDFRCTIADGEGYGTFLRYAGALLMQKMQGAGFVIAGRQVFEADLENHENEIEALESVRIRRSNAAANFPAKEVLNPFALKRTEIYAGVVAVLNYCKKDLPDARIISIP